MGVRRNEGRLGHSRVIQDCPAVLNDPRHGNEVEDLAVVDNVAIRQAHLTDAKSDSAHR